MQRGFSLVELAIVLVIIGLLVGSVLAGRNLIRAAELRAVPTEYGRYTDAVQSFRDKYFALPGDMANATSYWGAQDPTPATCAITASTDMKTCDGNGDNSIITSVTYGNEIFRFWQHLANAGYIEGIYSGVSAAAVPTYLVSLGTNAPRSKMTNAGWSLYGYGVITGNASTQLFDGIYRNSLFFGQVANFTSSPALTPEEAWSIDTKLDDGKPTTGAVYAWKSLVNNGCTTADTTGADWQLNNSKKACALIFHNPF